MVVRAWNQSNFRCIYRAFYSIRADGLAFWSGAYKGEDFDAKKETCTTSPDGKSLAQPDFGDIGSPALGGCDVTLVGILSRHQDEFECRIPDTRRRNLAMYRSN